MSTPKQQYYENLADSLIDKFNLRGIEGYYCETKEEALKLNETPSLINDYIQFPKFIKVIKEVTNDKNYRNSELAKYK